MSISGAVVPGSGGGAVLPSGRLGLLVRRNVLVMFMCVELMLNAANLTFVTFSRMLNDIGGQALVFFVLVVAAAEVVVGLGIVVAIFRRRRSATADDLHIMRGLTGPTPTEPTDLAMLHAAYLMPLLPLAGFVVLAAFGRRLGDPWAGWLGTATVPGSFVVAVHRLRRAALRHAGAGPRRSSRTCSPGSPSAGCR